MFSFQLHVFIIIVCEKIGRDKKGKSPWVKAWKKPSHKSQGKKSCQNRQGLMVYAIFTACPQATINKFCLLGVTVRVELDGTNKLSIALKFFWTKLCRAQQHDSFLQIIFLLRVSWDSVSVLLLAVSISSFSDC